MCAINTSGIKRFARHFFIVLRIKKPVTKQFSSNKIRRKFEKYATREYFEQLIIILFFIFYFNQFKSTLTSCAFNNDDHWIEPIIQLVFRSYKANINRYCFFSFVLNLTSLTMIRTNRMSFRRIRLTDRKESLTSQIQLTINIMLCKKTFN